jgi:hypothetical protein
MQKNKYASLIIALYLVFFISCSKNANDILDTTDPIEPETIAINYVSSHATNLNVVYFIPTDKVPLANYLRRISGIMLHTQEWYKKEMYSYGFGEKTFGLLVDETNATRIKITVIQGKNNSNNYPYEGGGAKAGEEITDYFSNNPSESTSNHTVVFMPSRTGDHGWNAGGVPFYGIDKWCYTLDYLNFDMNNWRDGSQEGSTNWIGGTMHEIGHALNLPHNQHKANDGWTSMMSWGNHEYNDSPENVHLTKASAVILNNNQVFNELQNFHFYTEVPAHTIKSLKIYADLTNLYVQSKFDVSIAINGVNIYNDPKTSSTDTNYNAISWATTDIIHNDSISVVMPLSEINEDYKQYPFKLKILFCHVNGNNSFENFEYKFKENIPDINLNVFEVQELDKSDWTISAYSSQEATGEGINNGHAIHLIDNNTTSFWHTAWSSSQPTYPHSFVINLNIAQIINGVTFFDRVAKYNGRPKDITIETSNNGVNFVNVGDFTLGSSTTKQIIELVTPMQASYFKVIVHNGYDDNSGEVVFFTHLAEVGLY